MLLFSLRVAALHQYANELPEEPQEAKADAKFFGKSSGMPVGSSLRCLLPTRSHRWSMSASGPECVKTLVQTLAMISENFIAREAHETVYPG